MKAAALQPEPIAPAPGAMRQMAPVQAEACVEETEQESSIHRDARMAALLAERALQPARMTGASEASTASLQAKAIGAGYGDLVTTANGTGLSRNLSTSGGSADPAAKTTSTAAPARHNGLGSSAAEHFGSLLGADFSHVQIHAGDGVAEEHRAVAVTLGKD
ncbi:MAG TPA: DUF4157 domain-containing protein, partial [Polyangiaceae bacterium]